MTSGAPGDIVPGNLNSRIFAGKAGSFGRPVVPQTAVMSPSPSQPSALPKAPYQRPAGQADWVQAVHERHAELREALPRVEPGQPETEDAVNALGRHLAQVHTAAAGAACTATSKAGQPPVLLSQAMEAQNAYHREVGATFQSGFEPQRHSTFVLGRPVQACVMKSSCEGHRLFHSRHTNESRSAKAAVLLSSCSLHNHRFWR